MEKELNEMSKDELGKLFPIIIVDYDPAWKKYFEQEKAYIYSLLKDLKINRIEHFGSTAIPGLAAKPTIDLLVEIPESNDIRQTIINIMTAHNYNHMKDHPTHLMFVKGYKKNGYDKICYHIHMGTRTEEQLWDRLYFKDYLIANPSITKQYQELKIKLSQQFKYDREAYTAGKNKFIEKITSLAKKGNSNG